MSGIDTDACESYFLQISTPKHIAGMLFIS